MVSLIYALDMWVCLSYLVAEYLSELPEKGKRLTFFISNKYGYDLWSLQSFQVDEVLTKCSLSENFDIGHSYFWCLLELCLLKINLYGVPFFHAVLCYAYTLKFKSSHSSYTRYSDSTFPSLLPVLTCPQVALLLSMVFASGQRMNIERKIMIEWEPSVTDVWEDVCVCQCVHMHMQTAFQVTKISNQIDIF